MEFIWYFVLVEVDIFVVDLKKLRELVFCFVEDGFCGMEFVKGMLCFYKVFELFELKDMFWVLWLFII